MKLLLLSFLILFSLVTKAQTIPVDSVTGKFKYEMVIQAEGLTQEQIYNRSKNWIVRNLKSSDNAVNFNDETKGAINATGNLLLKDQVAYLKYSDINLNFKFSVYCKEGRYKVIVDNFMLNYLAHLPNPNNPPALVPRTTTLEEGFKKEGLIQGKKPTEKMHLEANEKITKLIQDLKNSVASGDIPGDKGDW